MKTKAQDTVVATPQDVATQLRDIAAQLADGQTLALTISGNTYRQALADPITLKVKWKNNNGMAKVELELSWSAATPADHQPDPSS